MTYIHPPPDEFKATPQQLESFAKFKVWQDTISDGLLANDSWVFALRNMAAANAEREEKLAQQISMAKWVSWIREGPAHGLRRQHRFTRNVVGWVPTEKSTGAVTDVDARDEIDELQGLSRQEINNLKFQQAENHAPATAQQEAEQQADMWHKHWGDGLSINDVQWPDDMGEELPGIIAESICEAASTFPDETGLEWDRWHPKVVCRLSPQLMQLLVLILMECESTGCWSTGVGVVLIALLEKSDGGFRPIGLLPTKPRLWMRTRRILAKQWEAKHKRPWLYAGQGMGANVAAWV